MTTGKVDINGWPIWYEKFGCGPIPILLIPGAIGTGRTDFQHQLEGDHAFDLEKFTLIAVELPGWGRSTPPFRPYGSDVFNNDAECCVKLMQSLCYENFSILGWSDGAKVALMIAVNHPTCVKSVILYGIKTFATEKSTKNVLSTKNIDNWPQDLIENYLKVYNNCSKIQELWDRHMTFIAHFGKYFPNGISDNRYDTIKCRVLIIHGDRDPLVQTEQPLHVLKNIKGAKIHRFPFGSHNLHQKYKHEFKILTENFLLQQNIQ